MYLLTATVSIVLLSIASFVFQPCTGNEGSSIFSGSEFVYCKCSSSVLPSMVSFDLQRCTGTSDRLAVNCNCIYSSVFL